MDIQIIDTGYFYADGGAMFGAIPKTAWSRRYPSNETNGCVLAMRSLLLSNVPKKWSSSIPEQAQNISSNWAIITSSILSTSGKNYKNGTFHRNR